VIDGRRVRQARELRGLTQTELAQTVGSPQESIAKVEGGLLPGAELLHPIALATGFPAAFFQTPLVEEFPAGSLQFRARADMTRKQRAQAHRYAQLLFEIHQQLAAKVEWAPPLTIPRIDDESPIAAAQIARTSLGLSPDTPVPHLINTIERGGVAVLGLPLSLPSRDAFSGWASTKPFIAISSVDAGDRLRFTVAHELGHLVMHRAAKGSVVQLEAQADAFAAEFLMPSGIMRSLFKVPVTLASLAPLKPIWRVSVQALVRRAKDLQIISTRQYYYLSEQVARMGFRTKEGAHTIQPEKPRALRQLLEMFFGSPIDVRKAAAELRLTTSFLDSLVAAHAAGARPEPKTKSRVLQLRTLPKEAE
jgi:Zn-dependent peptidase ImmA (M78 family)/transcriptional regulator with XRE-family HTH domain